MSWQFERSEMSLWQEFGIASLLRNGGKYFCPPTYHLPPLPLPTTYDSTRAKRLERAAISLIHSSGRLNTYN